VTIKIGTDICSTTRVAVAYTKFGARLLRRLLTDAEISYVLGAPRHTVTRLAGRFAAKEAAAKALGTGWYGLDWKEVEIVHRPSGEPQLKLHGRAVRLAERKQLKHWEVTISHEREYACATVLAHSES
jgi:holo-[acyl-carrier protein] synthase